MRILWIETISDLGGAQCSLYEACTRLAANPKIELAVALPRGELADRLKTAGVKTFEINAIRPRLKGFGLFGMLANLFQSTAPLKRAIFKFSPDIIHANSTIAHLATAPLVKDIPMILHLRDIRVPRQLFRKIADHSAAIVCVSEEVEHFIARILPMRYFSKVQKIANGIDTERFVPGDKAAAREKFKLPQNVPIIGMAAHLIPWKRHHVFVRAAALILEKFPDAHFVIAGRLMRRENRNVEKSLQGLIGKLELTDRVHWITDCNDLEHLYPAFDLLIHPAIGEPFGRVVCEAMACGIPVVAAIPGGPEEIINDGANGILVEDGRSPDLANAAIRLLENPDKLTALAAKARPAVLKRFDRSRVATELADLYEKILHQYKDWSEDDEFGQH
ncbi:MAG: glycosyltransferase family 4 protein [Kiritimatiellae bacterium]|nr:glycosyltransferase family 4 protein [Kiritimatiellia bacterium]